MFVAQVVGKSMEPAILRRDRTTVSPEISERSCEDAIECAVLVHAPDACAVRLEQASWLLRRFPAAAPLQHPFHDAGGGASLHEGQGRYPAAGGFHRLPPHDPVHSPVPSLDEHVG